MKTYSGTKWHYIWVYEDLLLGGKSWYACYTITKPKKGGHTHNHCSNRELRLIHTANERKWLRKFLKQKMWENKQ